MITAVLIMGIMCMLIGYWFGLAAWENRDLETGLSNDELGVVINALIFSFGVGLIIWGILMFVGYADIPFMS